MAAWQIDVLIFDPFEGSLSEEWLRGVALCTLGFEVLPQAGGVAALALSNGRPVALSLVIADDETLRTLNWEYAGLDEGTDVLSFPLLSPGDEGEGDSSLAEDGPPFVVPKGEGLPVQLGEVILSYPQASRQAQTAGHPVQREVALLVAHGVLHLLGYDHATPEEEAAMWRKQDAVLARLFPQGVT
jgi:probable rRNA maturation factor